MESGFVQLSIGKLESFSLLCMMYCLFRACMIFNFSQLLGQLG